MVTTPLLQLASTPDDLAYWKVQFVLEVRKVTETSTSLRLYSLVCCKVTETSTSLRLYSLVCCKVTETSTSLRLYSLVCCKVTETSTSLRLYSLVCCFMHYFEDNEVCVIMDINPLNPSTHDSITLLLKFVYRNYIRGSDWLKVM